MGDTNQSNISDVGKKRDEDDEDALDFSPFWGIEKGAVLQEARCFNDSQLDARRCQQVRPRMPFLRSYRSW
jgi:coatomer protein complex subunit gamma